MSKRIKNFNKEEYSNFHTQSSQLYIINCCFDLIYSLDFPSFYSSWIYKFFICRFKFLQSDYLIDIKIHKGDLLFFPPPTGIQKGFFPNEWQKLNESFFSAISSQTVINALTDHVEYYERKFSSEKLANWDNFYNVKLKLTNYLKFDN